MLSLARTRGVLPAALTAPWSAGGIGGGNPGQVALYCFLLLTRRRASWCSRPAARDGVRARKRLRGTRVELWCPCWPGWLARLFRTEIVATCLHLGSIDAEWGVLWQG